MEMGNGMDGWEVKGKNANRKNGKTRDDDECGF